MIVLEGPDGAGKTSLAKKLSKDLGIPIAPKVVASDMTPLTDLAKWTELNVSRGFQRMIFDRHRIISEPIYGPATKVRQNPNFCDPGWVAEMTSRFYSADPIIIYCLPSLNDVRNNVNDPHTDNSAVRGRITAVYAGYVTRAALDLDRGVGRIYNYRTTKYDDVMEWTRRELNKRNEDYVDHHHLRVAGSR
jgi:GTPase SAR1 family protein